MFGIKNLDRNIQNVNSCYNLLAMRNLYFLLFYFIFQNFHDNMYYFYKEKMSVFKENVR